MDGQYSAARVAESFVMVCKAGIATVVHYWNTHSGFPGIVDAGADGLFPYAPVQDWCRVFDPELRVVDRR